MSDEGTGDEARRFEDTMDALEAQREEVEARFHELLDALSARIDELHAAGADAAAQHRRQVEARRTALAATDADLDELEDAGISGPTGVAGGHGALSRPLNGPLSRLARWLLGDALGALEHHAALQSRRLDALALRVDRLQATIGADAELADTVEATLARAHEALDAALLAQRQMLALVNAKDAEVLQRAVAGPLRRMEVLFDEFGRQQEALLSQLIGRRAELAELVRAVTPAPDDEM